MVKIINSLSLPDDKNKPKIEFPCKYPIKILGKSNENFIPDVLDIVSKFSHPLIINQPRRKKVKGGTFCSFNSCN